VSLTLEPSDAQKSNVDSVLSKFPPAERRTFDSIKDGLLTGLVEGTGLDYQRDVKPWLGAEAAVAILPGNREPGRALFLQSEDDAKATAAMQKATSEPQVAVVYRMIKGFAVVVERAQAEVLETVSRQTQSPSTALAAADKFTRVVDELEADRLALAWADRKALGELLKVGAAAAGAPPRIDLSGADVGPSAAELHAVDNGAVVEGLSETPGTTGGGTTELTNDLPGSTAAAVTAWNLGGFLEGALGTLLQQGVNAVSQIQQVQTLLGIDVVKDLFSWMRGEAVIAVGKPAQGATLPDLALVVDPTDRAAAQGAIDKILSLAKQRFGVVFQERPAPEGGGTMHVFPAAIQAGLQPAMALLPDSFILASSPEYLTTVAKGEGGFASSDAYTEVLGSPKPGTQFQVVVEAASVRQFLESLLSGEDKTEYAEDIKPWVDNLSAAGLRVRKDGKYTRLEVKATVD
jgi:hypothetical protein